MVKFGSKQYDSMLPATPVSEQTRKEIEQIALTERKSLAEVMREALELYLENRRKNVGNDGSESSR